MSANYHISMTKIMTFAPLGLFSPLLKVPLNSPKMDILYHIGQSYIFSIFFCHIEPTCQKICYYLTKIVVFFCRSEHTFPSTCVEKLMSARGEKGVFFVKKLTEADKWGGGVKIDQILADVICEPSLMVQMLNLNFVAAAVSNY